MGILKPRINDYILLIVCISIFSSGWYVRGLEEESKDLAYMESKKESQDIIDTIVSEIASNTSDQISKIKITNKTIIQEVRREIFKEPVYSECFITDDGLLIINRARLQSRSEPVD